jgi:hypothetical protein
MCSEAHVSTDSLKEVKEVKLVDTPHQIVNVQKPQVQCLGANAGIRFSSTWHPLSNANVK